MELFVIVPGGVLRRPTPVFEENQDIRCGIVRRWNRQFAERLGSLERILAIPSKLGRSQSVQVIQQHIITGIFLFLTVRILNLPAAEGGPSIIQLSILPV